MVPIFPECPIEEKLSYDNAVNLENHVNSTSVNVIENGDNIEDSSADSMSDSFSDEEKETIEHDNDDSSASDNTAEDEPPTEHLELSFLRKTKCGRIPKINKNYL